MTEFIAEHLFEIVGYAIAAAVAYTGFRVESAKLGGKLTSLTSNLQERRTAVNERIDELESEIDEVKKDMSKKVYQTDFREQGDKSWQEREQIRAEIKEMREKQNVMAITLGEVKTSQSHSLKILERLEKHFFEPKSKK